MSDWIEPKNFGQCLARLDRSTPAWWTARSLQNAVDWEHCPPRAIDLAFRAACELVKAAETEKPVVPE